MATCERSRSMPIEARPAEPSTNRPLRFAWKQCSVSLPLAHLSPYCPYACRNAACGSATVPLMR
eukprot:10779355-Heterocapsa_arctica.AAC.1